MNSPELSRLLDLGWKIPPKDTDLIFKPLEIDEDLISFPSESYDGEKNNAEATGFWATERASSIGRLLKVADVDVLWEIGAGNGLAAIPLRDQGFNVFPIEPLGSGARTLAQNGFTTFQATLEALNFPNNSIGAIGAFDVIEHLENPEMFLNEVFRALQPGGIFICSVPAYEWLFSDFDLSIGHYRRYSRRSLDSALEKSGLKSQSSTSLFGYLILPSFILRRIPFLLGRRNSFKSSPKSLGGDSRLEKIVGIIFALFSCVERKLKIPFGLSIVSISKKMA
jgi:2-polyprenyl-3-methyl-5-hydroxy-6-metoxy-1,4-benzoquinol methylase